MAKGRHLNNAPIVEAIIDFRVKLPSGYNVTEFSSLKETLSKSYPQMDESWAFEGGIMVKNKQIEQIVKDKGLRGYFFKSSDGKNVAQFREDGFTLSRLKPYSNWETVLAEAKKLWALYLRTAPPELVTRLATRYINRMDIPLPINDFGQYLTAPPIIPESLPQDVSRYLTRVTIRDPDFEIKANIIQALEKSSKPGYVAIILDIDVYKQMETGFSENQIWPIFENLRNLKNRIFFDSITEETARLFE